MNSNFQSNYYKSFDELFNLIKIANNGVVIISCETPHILRKVTNEIKNTFKNENIVFSDIQLDESFEDLISSVKEKSDNIFFRTKRLFQKSITNKKLVFSVDGSDKFFQKENLIKLNLLRDFFLDLDAPLIIWTKKEHLSNLSNNAPDFWRIRSKIFRFDEKYFKNFEGMLEIKNEKFETALKYFNMQLEEQKQIANDDEIATCYFNLAKLFEISKNFQNAIQLVENSILINKKIKKFDKLSLDYNLLASINQQMDQYHDAKMILLKSLELAYHNFSQKHPNFKMIKQNLSSYLGFKNNIQHQKYDLKDRSDDFQISDLSGIDLSNMNLMSIDLSGVNLKNSNLYNSKLDGSSMRNVNLGHSELEDSSLCDVDLSNSKLDGSSMRNVDLSNSKLDGSSMRNVDLSNSKLDHASLLDVTFENTILDRCGVEGTIMPYFDEFEASALEVDLTKIIFKDKTIAYNKATITYTQLLKEDLMTIRLVPKEGPVPDYKSGQFITLGLPNPAEGGKIVRREYYATSHPENRDFIEILVAWARKPLPGRLTTQIFNTKEGDEILWLKPAGKELLINEELPNGEKDDRRIVCIGEYAGISPFISFAQHLHDTGDKREIIILHGTNYVDELSYKDLLTNLENESIAKGKDEWNFRYRAAINRPQEWFNRAWAGQIGDVETFLRPRDSGMSTLEELIGDKITKENTIFYVCGWQDTVDGVMDFLKPKGFVTENDKREDGSFEVKTSVVLSGMRPKDPSR